MLNGTHNKRDLSSSTRRGAEGKDRKQEASVHSAYVKNAPSLPKEEYKATMLNNHYRLQAKCSGYTQEMHTAQTTLGHSYTLLPMFIPMSM